MSAHGSATQMRSTLVVWHGHAEKWFLIGELPKLAARPTGKVPQFTHYVAAPFRKKRNRHASYRQQPLRFPSFSRLPQVQPLSHLDREVEMVLESDDHQLRLGRLGRGIGPESWQTQQLELPHAGAPIR